MRRAIGSSVVGLLVTTVLSGVSIGQALSSAPLRSPPNSAPIPPPTLPLPNSSLLPTSPSLPPTRIWVHLNGAADLEQLRATNFNHYLRARKILAVANEICQPGPGHAYPTRFKADHPHCESMMWLTSYPPKKLLTFHLDDVGYIALISVKLSGGTFIGGPAEGSP